MDVTSGPGAAMRPVTAATCGVSSRKGAGNASAHASRWGCADCGVRRTGSMRVSSAPAVARVRIAAPDDVFSAVAERRAGVFIVTVAGEVDFASAAAEDTGPVDRAFEASGASDILVDLSGVTFIDSGGLSWLVRLRTAAGRRGGSIRLVGVPPRIERMLRISGVLPLFAG